MVFQTTANNRQPPSTARRAPNLMYDPNLPQENTLIDAAQMRGQLTGLKDLIDAVSGVTSAVVDAVNTLPPGNPAAVTVSVSGTVLHLSFDLPQGNDGAAGSNGNDGSNGSNGSDGLQGPPGQNGSDGAPGTNGSNGSDGAPGQPFTNFVVDNVTQLPPGSWPVVSANFDGNAVRLNFGIPQGNEGPQGLTGPQGPPFTNVLVDGVTTLNPGDNATVQSSFDGTIVHFQFGIPRGNDGATGAQGPQGEVTSMQLQSAIDGTSNNSNAVSTLNLTVSDPPTQGEMQAIADKLDELISALRR